MLAVAGQRGLPVVHVNRVHRRPSPAARNRAESGASAWPAKMLSRYVMANSCFRSGDRINPPCRQYRHRLEFNKSLNCESIIQQPEQSRS
jgi:hypothetical protein